MNSIDFEKKMTTTLTTTKKKRYYLVPPKPGGNTICTSRSGSFCACLRSRFSSRGECESRKQKAAAKHENETGVMMTTTTTTMTTRGVGEKSCFLRARRGRRRRVGRPSGSGERRRDEIPTSITCFEGGGGEEEEEEEDGTRTMKKKKKKKNVKNVAVIGADSRDYRAHIT